jgi:hypothetical protein
MDSKNYIRGISVLALLSVLILGCRAQVRIPAKMALLPDAFMNAKWGASVEEVKQAIEKDGNRWFEDRTDKSPFAIYASGTYLDTPVVISYFFTAKSKRFFRASVTFDNLRVYEKLKDDLIRKFNNPTFSQKDVDHWTCENRSLVILQKDTANVQFSFLNGQFAALNQKESE